ncbi:MAG: Rieske 2Fe-2S domain-containing protein, partial [Pseudomonadota bacterium]
PADPGCWRYLDGRIELDLAQAPELSGPQGALRLEGRGLPLRVLVFKDKAGDYHAFHNKCTHMGRRLDLFPGGEKVECCSVSHSAFDLSGAKVSGPAKGPVNAFPVTEETGRLTVKLSQT